MTGTFTFAQFVRRMPVVPLLMTIAVAVAVRMGCAAVLLALEPGMSTWVTYVLSVIPALAVAAGACYAFYRRYRNIASPS